MNSKYNILIYQQFDLILKYFWSHHPRNRYLQLCNIVLGKAVFVFIVYFRGNGQRNVID